MKRYIACGLALAFMGSLTACGGKSTGKAGVSSLASVTAASAEQCPSGGSQISVGSDKNRNNFLEEGEITASWPVCNGTVGVAGSVGDGSLFLATPLPPSEDCPFGAVELLTWIDDGDGVLGEAERASSVTQVLCSTQAEAFSGLVFTAPVSFAVSAELYKVNPDGSAPVKLAATTDATQTIESFKISPDKRMVAFCAQMESTEVAKLYVASLVDSREIVPVSVGLSGVSNKFEWLPDSSRLAYLEDSSLYTVLPDGTGRVEIDQSVNSLQTAVVTGESYLQYYTNSPYNLYFARPDGTSPIEIGDASFGGVSGHAISPGGTRVAYAQDNFSPPRICVAELAGIASGSIARKCAEMTAGAALSSPSWEPGGGSRVAFLSQIDTSYELYVGDASADTFTPELRSPDEISAKDHAWVAPGILLYRGYGNDIFDLYHLRLDGQGAPLNTNISQLASSEVASFAIAPGGAHVAYSIDTSDNTYALWAASLTSFVKTKLGDNTSGTLRSAAFSPDGQRFAYLTPSVAPTALHLANTDGSADTTIYTAATGHTLGSVVGWSPDGRVTFSLTGPDDRGLFVLPVTGGDPLRMSPTPQVGKTESFVWVE